MPRWISNPQQVGAVNLMDRQRHLRLRVFGEQFQDGFVGGHVLQLEVLAELPVGGPGVAVGARLQQHLEDASEDRPSSGSPPLPQREAPA